MTTYFMELPILRKGKKLTAEYSVYGGYTASLGEPEEPPDFEIDGIFLDGDALPEQVFILTDSENELAHEYLAENHTNETDDYYDEF